MTMLLGYNFKFKIVIVNLSTNDIVVDMYPLYPALMSIGGYIVPPELLWWRRPCSSNEFF